MVAAVLITGGVIYLLAPKGRSGPTARQWDGDAQQAFSELVDRVPSLVNAAKGWIAHDRPDDAFVDEVNLDLAAFVRSRDRVAALDTPKRFEDAHRLYEAAAALYVQTARVYKSAVGVQDVTQFDLLARRLREMGDRVFDRGRAALGIAPQRDTPEVDVNLPEEVPDWEAEGLAAGPPLDDQPAPPATSPPLRQETRPEQSRVAWERDVKEAKAPRPSDLRTKDGDRLRDVARRYVAAAEYLRDRPDPHTGREESARLRLSWLVYADAARASQLDLDAVAKQLERTAAMIWS